MSKKILVIESDTAFAKELSGALEEKNFAVRVIVPHDQGHGKR